MSKAKLYNLLVLRTSGAYLHNQFIGVRFFLKFNSASNVSLKVFIAFVGRADGRL